MHLLRETQKPTEGTDLKHPTTLGANQMAKVTYRGVQYDTDHSVSQPSLDSIHHMLISNHRNYVQKGVELVVRACAYG